MNDMIKNKLTLLPDQPGCYLMKDRQGIDDLCREGEGA